ncbi:hypothetical protein FOL47_008357 [Perkinsus chesapeaki]|uniref:Uncharacterized protein n=1 Tax=Perkinsus chesapeaki TaxID=330153 RepID=A0A7J6MUD5_PERCH|nr:hypothetical protein FOL47_008357 [Perkinsus chesapeaki]
MDAHIFLVQELKIISMAKDLGRWECYCIMFLENFDETSLYEQYRSHGESDASGMGPTPSREKNGDPLAKDGTSTEGADGRFSQILAEIRLLSVDDKKRVKAELELMLGDTHAYGEL